MASQDDSQATQPGSPYPQTHLASPPSDFEPARTDSDRIPPATQNALDPRRLGKQNSGFSDEDIADIVCLLYPNTDNASREVQRIASENPYSPHIVGRYAADAVDADLYREDEARKFGRTRGVGDYAIVLKLSSTVKSPNLGFTFGRNSGRCDICFVNDPLRRLSNIHFRIYINNHGVVMLEDQSTNGTIVDDVMLKKRRDGRDGQANQTKRVLTSGTTIKILMHENAEDLAFVVRLPRRDGDADLEAAYRGNLQAYFRKLGREVDLDRTIGPGPSGPVNLFPPPFRNKRSEEDGLTTQAAMPQTEFRQPQEFRGGERYNRVNMIGKGAFAVVYKVTDKYTGEPYAAKELDKRKFIKNGVLDQKVENEMKIMQRVSHANIVQYIEHFDWDQHQFIIVMEYVPGGDLGKLIQSKGNIREPYVKIMARQLIDALGYLHDNKITHRDVKPDNILVYSTDPFIVKLTDFGLSKMIDTEQTFLKTFCGTLLYCAPEVYSEYSTYDEEGRRVRPRERRPVNKERYDHAVDVWSLGGVLFYALTGQPPFPVRNGTSYTELLHHIMTQPLDVSPLVDEQVSPNGIYFLNRMIDRRPETRATITELQNHPWLNPSATESADEISDDGLEQRASQLSLYHRSMQLQGQSIDDMASELMEPGIDLSMDLEEDKENYTFGQPAPNRLWGEVNNSAIGSSGAINEDHLNIPISASFGETEIIDPVVRDSFESEDLSTPRQNQKQQQGRLIVSSNSTIDEKSHSIAQVIASQSLGGDSGMLENLNMKSLARPAAHLRSEMSDLNTSKRKPAYDTSDEFEGPSSNLKPSFKRLKSKDEDLLDYDIDDDEEQALLALVPPAVKSESGRLIDYPVDKRVFWDAAAKETWHLDYPEMTHSQYNAFKSAAERRKEEFSPGQTPLWDVAMKWFPPTADKTEAIGPLTETRPFLRRDSRSVNFDSEWDLPPTAPVPASDDGVDSLPDTLPPEGHVPRPSLVTTSSKTLVARLTSSSGSLVKGIGISITDPVISWGRASDNTSTYPQVMEPRVPKHAFRIVLWREGYTASSNCFRPWEARSSPSSNSTRASPEPDSYAFYISTKATNGLRINNNQLPSFEPKNSKAPSRHWMKLYNGDTVVIWGDDNVNNQAKLTFECFWGGSSTWRPSDEPPTCVPEDVARKLDNTWIRAEKNLQHDRIKEEAMQAQQYRMTHMARELERSRKFEAKCAEAARVLALRNSRQSSPMSAPPAMGRTMAKLRHGSPATMHTQT
ncbi:hypothetical protein JX266_008217 [Neoarthrinium moseri]|nr:hypothetical protein JX266_008217 [Neoarthrinium moseri]